MIITFFESLFSNINFIVVVFLSKNVSRFNANFLKTMDYLFKYKTHCKPKNQYLALSLKSYRLEEFLFNFFVMELMSTHQKFYSK
jgi:hypothetical protein